MKSFGILRNIPCLYAKYISLHPKQTDEYFKESSLLIYLESWVTEWLVDLNNPKKEINLH